MAGVEGQDQDWRYQAVPQPERSPVQQIEREVMAVVLFNVLLDFWGIHIRQ